MKYVRTKKDEIRTTTNKGHHTDLASRSEVKSAGYYKRVKGKVKTYKKSYGFNIYPQKGDATLIEKKT